MATAVFGKVEDFDSKREDWTQYVERLGHFSMLTVLQKPKRSERYFFLSLVPLTPLAPAKPGSKSYDDLVKQLSERHDPTPSETATAQVPLERSARR